MRSSGASSFHCACGRRRRIRTANDATPPIPTSMLSRAMRKSLALTATVSLCFAVCWLPWSVAMLLIAFEVNLGGQVSIRTVQQSSD